MKSKRFNNKQPLLFKHFARKEWSLFAVLGKVVIIGTLSVATADHSLAKSTHTATMEGEESTSVDDDSGGVVLGEVEVNGSRVPMLSQLSAKTVTVITRDDIQQSGAQSVSDLLKLTTGADVRQRGGFGVQTDISIDGGTFDQVAILLNGIDLSSSQTGHNAADFPVGIDDIERIEVLQGAAARIAGTNAFSGSINIITRKAERTGATVEAQGGSYGTWGAAAAATLTHGAANAKGRHRLSIGYDQSDGGTDNSDFKKRRAYYHGGIDGNKYRLQWQAGIISKDYGANTFYSAKFPNQYEETRRIITSAGADIRMAQNRLVISPAVYWHRDYDHFQLTKGLTGAQAGENYHRLDNYGASLNATLNSAWGKTSVGIDIKADRIISTTYGELMDSSQWKSISGTDRSYCRKDRRTSTTLFAEHNIILDQWTLSAGVMANYNSAISGGMRLYPGIDIAYRPNQEWKIFAAVNSAMRAPTYTDLYTNNSAQKGSHDLKPEKNLTSRLGAMLRKQALTIKAEAFYSHATNLIDWVYQTQESQVYQALNIGKLDNVGLSANIEIRPQQINGWSSCPITAVKLGYAYIWQTHDTEQQISKSLYALEYLRHKLTAQIDHHIWKALKASWTLRWQERMNGYTPYCKIDGKIMWEAQRYSLWLSADNITNHRYYDLGAVQQPGIWIMAGGKVNF